MNARTIKLVAAVLVVSILLTVLPINTNVYADAKANFAEEGISVTFERSSAYDNKTQVNATVNNTGKKTIKDWTLEIGYKENVNVTTIWNAVLSNDNGIKITNESYNGEITDLEKRIASPLTNTSKLPNVLTNTSFL